MITSKKVKFIRNLQMVENKIGFWLTLSEINTILTVVSIEHPEYEERISKVKSVLTSYITEGLETAKELKKVEIDSWYERSN